MAKATACCHMLALSYALFMPQFHINAKLQGNLCKTLRFVKL